MKDVGCTVDDCANAHYGKGLCRKHWMRMWRRGTTDDGPGRGQPAELLSTVRPKARTTTCGHPDRKHFAKGLCHSCYMVAWMKAHPDANSGNTWAKNNPERHLILKRRQVLRKHGITPEDYDALWDQQEGKCANPGCGIWCPKVLTDYRKGLQVDHCHATGRVRGLLCGGCNVALGHIKDDARRLAGLIEYLGLN